MVKRISIVAGALLVAGIIALVVWKTAAPAEPVYGGKRLTVWLEARVVASQASATNTASGLPDWKVADQALDQIGTNAIPTLLKLIAATDPPPAALKVLDWAQSHSVPFVHYHYASSRNQEALVDFRKLGEKARSAVPALLKIYEANRSFFSKEAAGYALAAIGPSSGPALPVLLRDFANTNDQVRFDALTAVLQLGGDIKLVMPAMQAALKDTKSEIRWNAAVALSTYGSRARPAVPALLEALQAATKAGEVSLQEQIETALWRIAPEQVGKPLVVEDATPLVAGGVTTGGLDVAYKGGRRTVIPSGRAVPAVAQFWNSGPREPLSLYRGVGRAEPDHWLGDFQVVGIEPAPAVVNVSLQIVIANQQIYLSARDNSSNVFLEVRRIEK